MQNHVKSELCKEVLTFLTTRYQSSNKFINKRLSLLTELSGSRAIDILFFTPNEYILNNNIKQAGYKIYDYALQKISIEVIIENTISIPFANNISPSSPLKIEAKASLGEEVFILQFFGGLKNVILNTFKIGAKLIIYGELSIFMDKLYINHPEICKFFYPDILPVYSLTKGINSRFVATCINDVFNTLKKFDNIKHFEWIEGSQNTFLKSLYKLHNPDLSDISIIKKYKNRIIFDELIARLLFVKKLTEQNQATAKQGLIIDTSIRDKVQELLGFTLTKDQLGAIDFVLKQLQSDSIKTTLIQGDVGSGKTAVALVACLFAVNAGLQAVVIAPTFILTMQHFKLFDKVCSSLNVRAEVITSKDTKKQRERKLTMLCSGEINILISTHAAFEDSVVFKNLGLVIVDEQQKFGVDQRLSILKKGCFNGSCDVVFMTATPIPRTTAMIAFGNIQSYEIKQKPANRKEIKTQIISQTKLNSLIDYVKQTVAKGQKTYWVCPLIEESEKSNLVPVKRRLEDLQAVFGLEVAIIHGKMKEVDREREILRFINGEIKVLVATTVIEVGVDVKDATTMIVENAERFGLSVLHQLRGRVGRGDLQSGCFFVYSQKTSKVAIERLNILKDNSDGFLIAKKDMELRGLGQVFGKMQSGFNDFLFFNYEQDIELQEMACNIVINGTNNALKIDFTLAENILLNLFKYKETSIVSC
jgi:ATP-dependent DNA helicase RecG